MALSSQTEKAKRFWRLRCEHMLAHDQLIKAKENEIVSLHAQLAAPRPPIARSTDSGATVFETAWQDSVDEFTEPTSRQLATSTVQPSGKGKAPPVDLLTGESSDFLWEDRNNWTESEKLLHLAGHLRGKAAQE